MDIGGSRLSLKKELREGTLDTSHAAFIGRLDLNTERLCRGGDDGDAGTKLLSCLLVRYVYLSNKQTSKLYLHDFLKNQTGITELH